MATSIYSFEGFVIFMLYVICSCAYIVRIPKVKNLILAEKHGFRGTLYKSAVLGVRLHWLVAITCIGIGIHKLLM